MGNNLKNKTGRKEYQQEDYNEHTVIKGLHKGTKEQRQVIRGQRRVCMEILNSEEMRINCQEDWMHFILLAVVCATVCVCMCVCV